MKNTDSHDDSIEANESDYLFKSQSQIPNSGNGLFTAITVYKGETIAIFRGVILTDKQANELVSKGEDQYFISLLNGSILDSMSTECFAKYANDVEGSYNSPFKNNSKIGLDEIGNVCIIATRNIKSGDEIFCSYGKRYWQKHKGL